VPPAKTECPLAGSGTVGLTVTQWASKKQFVDLGRKTNID